MLSTSISSLAGAALPSTLGLDERPSEKPGCVSAAATEGAIMEFYGFGCCEWVKYDERAGLWVVSIVLSGYSDMRKGYSTDSDPI